MILSSPASLSLVLIARFPYRRGLTHPQVDPGTFTSTYRLRAAPPVTMPRSAGSLQTWPRLLRKAEGPHPPLPLPGGDPGCARRVDHRPRDGKGPAQGRARQILWRRRDAHAQLLEKQKGGQKRCASSARSRNRTLSPPSRWAAVIAKESGRGRVNRLPSAPPRDRADARPARDHDRGCRDVG